MDPLGDRPGRRRIRQVDEQDAELIPAPSRGRIGQPNLVVQAAAHFPDDVVPGRVTVLVVDPLEAVQIDADQGRELPAALCGVDGPDELLVETVPGQQAGERVASGLFESVVGAPDDEDEGGADRRGPPADLRVREREHPAEDDLVGSRDPIRGVEHPDRFRERQVVAKDDGPGDKRRGRQRQDERTHDDRNKLDRIGVDADDPGRQEIASSEQREPAADGAEGEGGVVGQHAVPGGLTELAGFDRRDHRDDGPGGRPAKRHRGDDEWDVEREDAMPAQPFDTRSAQESDRDPVDEAKEDPLPPACTREGDALEDREVHRYPCERDDRGDDLGGGVGEERGTVVAVPTPLHRGGRTAWVGR